MQGDNSPTWAIPRMHPEQVVQVTKFGACNLHHKLLLRFEARRVRLSPSAGMTAERR